MRTLSEVIEIASDWTNGFDEMSIEKQMLHYLKEYRNKEMFYNQSVDHMVLMMNEHEDRVAMYLAEMHKNNPLTWSELKQMEGKPVWVELLYHHPEQKYKYWDVIKRFDAVEGYDLINLVQTGYLHKSLLNREWQAYRKERS